MAQDAATNPNLASNIISTINDTLLPEVISVVPSTTGPTVSPTISFAVTFSEPVENFDMDDVTIVHSGTSHTGASVTGSGNSYTITVTGLAVAAQQGTFTIRIEDSSDASDVAGNGLAASMTGPTVTLINAGDSAARNWSAYE